MPRQMTEKERQEFLAEPRIGVLSVARGGDRPPHTTPVWYAYEPGGSITIFTGSQGRKSRKAALIETAGVLSLTVQREEFPYKYVTVEGSVVGWDRPPSAEQMLAIVRRYLPEEAAQGFVEAEVAHPGSGPVHFTVRPDRWLTFDFAQWMKGSEERSGSSIARIVETDRMRLAEMLKSEGASRSVLTS